MNRLSFRDLTPEEIALVSNGCGGKGSWVPVPDWLFSASCDHHDFEYWRGGTEQDRAAADWGFYTAMRKDAKQTPWWYPTRLALLRAWAYYKAVRWFAKPYFHFGAQCGRLELEALKKAA